MKTPVRKYIESFHLRMPAGMRKLIEDAAAKNGQSKNEELVRRIEQSFQIPEDIAKACGEMPDVKDRFDFAVRVLKQAGVEVVTTPAKKRPPKTR